MPRMKREPVTLNGPYWRTRASEKTLHVRIQVLMDRHNELMQRYRIFYALGAVRIRDDIAVCKPSLRCCKKSERRRANDRTYLEQHLPGAPSGPGSVRTGAHAVRPISTGAV